MIWIHKHFNFKISKCPQESTNKAVSVTAACWNLILVFVESLYSGHVEISVRTWVLNELRSDIAKHAYYSDFLYVMQINTLSLNLSSVLSAWYLGISCQCKDLKVSFCDYFPSLPNMTDFIQIWSLGFEKEECSSWAIFFSREFQSTFFCFSIWPNYSSSCFS